MRVTGKVKNCQVHILVDSVSTHNFLDLSMAKRLHCEMKRIPPLQVVMANGQKLQCTSMYKGFEWSLMGGVFSSYVMLVPLGSCEMVLGVQWLASLGPILCDFEKLRMEFKYKGERVVLKETQKSNMEWLEGKRSQQKLHKSA